MCPACTPLPVLFSCRRKDGQGADCLRTSLASCQFPDTLSIKPTPCSSQNSESGVPDNRGLQGAQGWGIGGSTGAIVPSYEAKRRGECPPRLSIDGLKEKCKISGHSEAVDQEPDFSLVLHRGVVVSREKRFKKKFGEIKSLKVIFDPFTNLKTAYKHKSLGN